MSGTDSRRALAARSTRAVAAAVGFALISLDVTRAGPATRTEQRLLGPPPGGTGPWQTMTKLGGRPALATMTITAAALAAAAGRSPWRPIAPVATGVGVRWALMHAIDRPRPPRTWWRSTPDGASFPSRHATAATLGLLSLRAELPDFPALAPAVAALVAAECYSRLRLGVHWPTDVLAGALLALCVHSTLTPSPTPANHLAGWDGDKVTPVTR